MADDISCLCVSDIEDSSDEFLFVHMLSASRKPNISLANIDEILLQSSEFLVDVKFQQNQTFMEYRRRPEN